MATLSTATFMTDLDSRKALGRAHLNADRLQDALAVYTSILRDYPEDLEAHLFLGDCYLAGGDRDSAKRLYERARTLAPANEDIENRLQLADSIPVGRAVSEKGAVPTQPAAIARLLQRLTGRNTPVSDAEVSRAARMLEDIIHHPQPAQEVARRLEEIDALLPALLELNIRQARADGRPELVRALEDLLHYIDLQIRIKREDLPRPAMEDYLRRGGPVLAPAKLMVLVPPGGEPAPRARLLCETLESRGLRPTVADRAELETLRAADAVLVHNPHTSAAVMETLALCAGLHLPVVLDLDADYERMPMDHPAYARLGMGAPASARAYAAALQLADAVTVPSQSFADTLRAAGRNAHVMPDGWSRRNELWEKKPARRHTLHLGWVGSVGQMEDLAQIRRAIVRVMREFPQTQLLVGGDVQAYQLFDSLPESRRMYLPPAHADDYPYLLGQVDILLVPLRPTAFAQSVSDLPLVEAGVKGIPWVASPVPAFTEWGAGGLPAASIDEWHLQLRTLILDESLRASLAQAGSEKAQTREAAQLAPAWETLLAQILRPRGAAAP